MPVEIRELIIRATIIDDANVQPDDASTDKTPDRQALIQECVDQVLKVLKKAKNR